MIDIAAHIKAVQREAAHRTYAHGEGRSVLLSRRYDAAIEDVWDAITDPDRMRRWFLPVTGEFQVGGKFQLEGNAGGEILRCEKPSLLEVSFGEETSVVQVRLSSVDHEATMLVLEHTVPAGAHPATGVLSVGPGWDGALLGLGIYFDGQAPENPEDFANSPIVFEFTAMSIREWTVALEAEGVATGEEIAEAVRMSTEHYVPSMPD